MRILTALVTCASALLVAGPASAEPRTVKANTRTIVGYFAVRSAIACEIQVPDKYAISRQPSHGKVELTVRSVNLGKDAKECPGGKGKAIVATYTPDRNYKGRDGFVIRYELEKYLTSVLPTSEYWRVDLNIE